MSPHPLRLLFVSYAIAGLTALLVPGTTPLQAFMIFWFGGAGLALPLATLPGIRTVFTQREVLASPSEQVEEDEYQMWDDDQEYQMWDEDIAHEGSARIGHEAEADHQSEAKRKTG